MIKHHFSIFFLALCCTVVSCHYNNQNNLAVMFDRVDYLQSGAKVYMGGKPVGGVTSLELLHDSVLVTLQMDPQIKIPVGSAFFISPSVIGDAYITVEPALNSKYLSGSDTASGYYTAKTKLNDIIADSAQRVKADKAINKIGEGVKELLDAVKDSAKAIGNRQ